MKYAYLLVEGPHDVEVIGRILKTFEANRIKDEEDLDPFWSALVPRTFPINGDLVGRVPLPTFFESDSISIAVQNVGGDSKFVKTLTPIGELGLLDTDLLSAFALFFDADEKNAKERCSEITSQLIEAGIPFFSSLLQGLDVPGIIEKDVVKVGAYVFPDNDAKGTVEHLLLQCAGETYGDLLGIARDYVGGVEDAYRKKWGQSGELKVLVGCIANVLRPGKANQVSIQDNKWICPETMHLESVSKLYSFLEDLLN
ncbi:MAG: DUF3226 domain-containing protein [Tumebacillaceae bacterium]